MNSSLAKLAKNIDLGKCLFFSLLILLFYTLFTTNPVMAQNNALPSLQSEPIDNQTNLSGIQEYKVGIQLMDVKDVNRLSGTYDMTFWVTIVSDKTDFTVNPPPELDFVNGDQIQTSGLDLEPHLKKFKVSGVFQNGFDFRMYPFEILDMPIIVEPFFPLTADKVILTANKAYSGQDSSADSDIPGWNLSPGTVESTIHDYPWGHFSRLVVHYDVSSPAFMTLLKKLFTVLILDGLVIGAFWFKPDSLSERTAIAVGAILAATYFHAQFLLGELPPLGYLTVADKIMMASYALYTFCIISVLVHNRLSLRYGDKYDLNYSRKVDFKMRIIAPIVLVGVFLILYPL